MDGAGRTAGCDEQCRHAMRGTARNCTPQTMRSASGVGVRGDRRRPGDERNDLLDSGGRAGTGLRPGGGRQRDERRRQLGDDPLAAIAETIRAWPRVKTPSRNGDRWSSQRRQRRRRGRRRCSRRQVSRPAGARRRCATIQSLPRPSKPWPTWTVAETAAVEAVGVDGAPATAARLQAAPGRDPPRDEPRHRRADRVGHRAPERDAQAARPAARRRRRAHRARSHQGAGGQVRRQLPRSHADAASTRAPPVSSATSWRGATAPFPSSTSTTARSSWPWSIRRTCWRSKTCAS